jgi:hypothetical protein
MEIEYQSVECPYCGETIELAMDCSAGDAELVEDCQVCCRPIYVNLRVDANGKIGTLCVCSESE